MENTEQTTGEKTISIKLVDLYENGLRLKDCTDEQRDDNIFVEVAVEENFHAMQYASERLRNDSAFVVRMLGAGRTQHILHYCSKAVQNDYWVLSVALRNADAATTKWLMIEMISIDTNKAIFAAKSALKTNDPVKACLHLDSKAH